jgi:hypothetical protein
MATNEILQKNMIPCDTKPEVVSIEPIIRLHANSAAVDRATLRYRKWHASLPAQTSLLNHRLCFLQLVEEESGDSRLKENEQLAETLLDGTGVQAIGDVLDWKGKRYTLVWRKISQMYGVEMCFQSDDGTMLHREFHD